MIRFRNVEECFIYFISESEVNGMIITILFEFFKVGDGNVEFGAESFNQRFIEKLLFNYCNKTMKDRRVSYRYTDLV